MPLGLTKISPDGLCTKSSCVPGLEMRGGFNDTREANTDFEDLFMDSCGGKGGAPVGWPRCGRPPPRVHKKEQQGGWLWRYA